MNSGWNDIEQVAYSSNTLTENTSHTQSVESYHMDSSTPLYHRQLKNLMLHSPMTSSGAENTLGGIQDDMFLLGTPSTSHTNIHETSPNGYPRSNTPLFDHHKGSPFRSFSPFNRNEDRSNTTFPHSSRYIVSSPSPKLMPIKLVDQAHSGSKPYDPSASASNSMKRSPLVKSIDATSGFGESPHDSDQMPPLNLRFELSTSIRNSQDQGHPPLPDIKLTPRMNPRKICENSHPPLPSIKLTPRSTPRKRYLDGDEASSHCLSMEMNKLTPKNQRKVSVDEYSASCRGSKAETFTPDLTRAERDPIIPMVLSVDDGKGYVPETKHFPITPKLKTRKSRSLFDLKSKDDSIQNLLIADAMIEAVRANESLTDDEDGGIECDPDFVLCSLPSFGNQRSSAKVGAGLQIAPKDDGSMPNKKPSFLPIPTLNQNDSSTSLLGMNHLQDAPEHNSTGRAICQSESMNEDQFKSIQYNASMCSLALSVDSTNLDTKRPLFTPPPFLEERSGFRALSPPPLLPYPEPARR